MNLLDVVTTAAKEGRVVSMSGGYYLVTPGNPDAADIMEILGLSHGLTITDRKTGNKYEIYIDNGKLTMAESEG